MKEPTIIIPEQATAQVRLFPSDAKKVAEQARLRHTISAQIIHEALVLAEKTK